MHLTLYKKHNHLNSYASRSIAKVHILGWKPGIRPEPKLEYLIHLFIIPIFVLFSLEELFELGQGLFGLFDAGHGRLEPTLGLLRVGRYLVLVKIDDLVGLADLS